MVAQHRTRLGTCDVMRQNPHNAVLSLGHANGTVSLWSPNITTSLVKMLCHRVRYVFAVFVLNRAIEDWHDSS